MLLLNINDTLLKSKVVSVNIS